MTALDRFMAKAHRTDACWEWTGARLHGQGYGRVRVGGREVLAHRRSWELHFGKAPPADMCVCHRCDNRLCVRPDHLFLGTHQDNIADMVSKLRQRGPSSENSHKAKLTPVEVKRIRSMANTGTLSQIQMGAIFGVCHSTVSEIIRGLTWRRALEA